MDTLRLLNSSCTDKVQNWLIKNHGTFQNGFSFTALLVDGLVTVHVRRKFSLRRKVKSILSYYIVQLPLIFCRWAIG